MIVKHTSRAEILAKLEAKVRGRIPIFIASAGSGLVAQLLEKAGADCINTFSGARLRANGMGTMSMMWPILDSNTQTLDYTREDIMPALKGDAFVCACLNANDPLKDMRMVLNQCKEMGVYSVSNIGPSISYVDHDSEIYRVLNKSGITLDHEIELLKLAKEMEMVSIGLGFNMDDCRRLVGEAQPDLFCFHCGTTQGGLKGYDSGERIEQAAERIEKANQELRKLKPDVMMIAHGSALVEPADFQYVLDHTSSDGIWTGSSTERIPIEQAVFSTAKQFAGLRFPQP
ncbi:MAG: phosphoenolpyruvate hydrolase family protein [Saprospiraceae bacterium]|nr:phosphoenolpyruvate hydrolase family protein [Saprospiraceae bacterium]